MVRQRAPGPQQPKRGVPALILLACAAHDSGAVERLTLQIGQVSSPSVQATRATVALNVSSPSSPTLDLRVDQLRLPTPAPLYSNLEIGCASLIVNPPLFGCGQGTVSATGGPTNRIDMTAAGTFDSSTGATSLNGAGLKIAGADTRFSGKLEQGVWSAQIHADGLDLVAARKLATPWFTLPDTETLTGHLTMEVTATGQLATPTDGTQPAVAALAPAPHTVPAPVPLTAPAGAAHTAPAPAAHTAATPTAPLRATLTAATTDLNFANAPGTTVGQNLSATLNANIIQQPGKLTSDIQLTSTAGQALTGVVLLDFALNPLSLRTHLETSAQQLLTLTAIQLSQKDLITAQGNAQVNMATSPMTVTQAHADIQRLECAAAYRSFLQLALATTDFGALNVGGHASGTLDMANNSVRNVSANLIHVSAADSTAKLSLANANGQLNWAADTNAPIAPSQLSWSSSSLYGLLGGPVELGFTAHGMDFELAGDTRFPIFDGAMIVHKLAVRKFGADDAELDFDAHIEPISMPRLSKAFGWPSLSGQLAGRIPGVTYRDHVLAVEGDLTANVFDGTITASRLKLRDPLGPWPRLDGNVTARELDLDLLTHTFKIGSISGRLDADIKGLELFNWSPVAFDARLHTTPGDRSEHLISQRAVTSISNVGGGGGGVAAALQSGVLRFFDKFHYDRIGISCQLRDEVCLMTGLEPAREGYYLVKGRGLPRIDIIGNAGRVDWTQLVGQISASIHSQNIVVR